MTIWLCVIVVVLYCTALNLTKFLDVKHFPDLRFSPSLSDPAFSAPHSVHREIV